MPGIALRIANQQLAHYATTAAHLERVELNPFSLELTLWGLKIGERDKEQLSFERLYANLQLDSLWTGALHLADVRLDKLKSEVQIDKQGKLNLAQLFKLPASEPAPAGSESKPLALRIERIQLAGGHVHFVDQRPSEPIEFLYDEMDLELKSLSTVPDEQANMTLVATSPAGGRIDWSGNLSLIPFASQGKLKVTDGKMKAWWPYVRDALPLALEDGTYTLSTDYSLNLDKATELQLSNATISVASFAIKSPAGRPLVRLERLEVSESSLDLLKQQVIVGKIRSQKLETWAAREADGQLDWQKLFASQPARSQEKKAPATTPKADKTAPDKAWQVLVKDVQLRDYRVHLEDRQPNPPVALELSPLNLDAQDFDSLNQSPLRVKLDTGVGKQGRLQASGEVNLSPVNARLQVTTKDIDLRVAQSYISPLIRLELRSGMLGSELKVNLKSTEPLALNVTGRVQVDQLHTLDTLKSRDFVKWQRLVLDGLDYQHGDSLSITKVNLTQPYARFMINENGTTNINDLLIPQPATSATVTPAKSSTAPAKQLGIHIGEISINDGSANFADFSLKPHFATAIQQLNGRIGTLDSRRPNPANVDVRGKVDRYAPVTIKGSLNPFSFLTSLDIATSFKRVELTTLTPYSGKFAGYRIRKGRVSLDLHYQITRGQLKAENKVLVEQLQLGEKVDSPDAVDLPIRLAVALLKDTNGNISIELPVSGDLNNPQFSIMPIVWQTLRNLVLRAVQAPFKFIAGLVNGGGEDLSSVSFAPGSSELNNDAQGTLMTLSKALKERPALRLEIEGTSAPSSDGPLIAEQRLEREYQSTYYKILQRRGDKVPAQASQLEVPDREKSVLLEGIYRSRLNKQPPAEWKALGVEDRAAKLREGILGSWSESDLLLRQLGQARASRIKDFLVDKAQLDDQRVYLIDANLGQPESDGRVATPLHLDSD